MSPQLRPRQGDVSGQKWVDDNHDLKEELIKANNGVMPFTPAFTTSYFPGCDDWSEEKPPDILFYLQIPESAYKKGTKPDFIMTEDGKPLIGPNDRPLRDFPILPQRVSLDVEGWKIEAWRRIDPRITYRDIYDRLTTDLGEAQKLTKLTAKKPSTNILQNHSRRNCRALLHSYTDYHRREEPHRVELLSLQQLNADNIHYNTVLNVYDSPVEKRLIKLKFTRKNLGGVLSAQPWEVTPGNWAETTYPLDFFTRGFSQTFGPSEGMLKAFDLLFTLQERAYKHGYHDLNWEKLDRDCLPTSWYDRTANKSMEQSTYDGGCETCTWKDPRDSPDQDEGPDPKKRRLDTTVATGTDSTQVEVDQDTQVNDQDPTPGVFFKQPTNTAATSEIEDEFTTDGAQAILDDVPMRRTLPITRAISHNDPQTTNSSHSDSAQAGTDTDTSSERRRHHVYPPPPVYNQSYNYNYQNNVFGNAPQGGFPLPTNNPSYNFPCNPELSNMPAPTVPAIYVPPPHQMAEYLRSLSQQSNHTPADQDPAPIADSYPRPSQIPTQQLTHAMPMPNQHTGSMPGQRVIIQVTVPVHHIVFVPVQQIPAHMQLPSNYNGFVPSELDVDQPPPYRPYDQESAAQVNARMPNHNHYDNHAQDQDGTQDTHEQYDPMLAEQVPDEIPDSYQQYDHIPVAQAPNEMASPDHQLDDMSAEPFINELPSLGASFDLPMEEIPDDFWAPGVPSGDTNDGQVPVGAVAPHQQGPGQQVSAGLPSGCTYADDLPASASASDADADRELMETLGLALGM